MQSQAGRNYAATRPGPGSCGRPLGKPAENPQDAAGSPQTTRVPGNLLTVQNSVGGHKQAGGRLDGGSAVEGHFWMPFIIIQKASKIQISPLGVLSEVSMTLRPA